MTSLPLVRAFTWFSMFVYSCTFALFLLYTDRSVNVEPQRELEVEFKFQRCSCKIFFPLPPHHQEQPGEPEAGVRQTQTADLQTGWYTRKTLLWNALTESLSLKFKSFKNLVQGQGICKSILRQCLFRLPASQQSAFNNKDIDHKSNGSVSMPSLCLTTTPHMQPLENLKSFTNKRILVSTTFRRTQKSLTFTLTCESTDFLCFFTSKLVSRC